MICLFKPHDLHCDWMECRQFDAQTVRNIVEHPAVIPDKSNVPLAIWGNPVPNPERNMSGKMRCVGANVDSLYAFFLDYDSGMTIEQFKERYRHFAYILYTSYSYGIKPGDRFRVILPIASPFPVKWLGCPTIKRTLLWHFPGVDSTCFDRGHWQKLPAISKPDAPYVYIRSEGPLWGFNTNGWDSFKGEYEKWLELASTPRKPSSFHSHAGALAHAQQKIDQTLEGERDKTLFRTLSWLHDIGCTDVEAAQLRVWSGFEETLYEKIRRIWR